MSAGDTQPTQPLPGDYAYAQPAAPRRRRPMWPWLVTIVVVIGLAVIAWFAGEAIARSIVTTTIREQVITQLALPADQDVQVDVPGTIIPQLISGTLGEVTITSEDVPMGSFEGDVTVTAHDVPIRGGDMGEASATVVLDQEQLRALMSTVDRFPADSLGLAAPDVTMATELSLFGVEFPLGIALTPSAVDGDLVLSPAALQLAGATVTAAGLRDQFGSLADAVLRDWTVCIAEYIPAGATMTEVAVVGDTVTTDFDIDGAIISDPSLQENGTC